MLEKDYTISYFTDNYTTINTEKLLKAVKDHTYLYIVEDNIKGVNRQALVTLQKQFELDGLVGDWKYPFSCSDTLNEALIFGLHILISDSELRISLFKELYECYKELNPSIGNLPIKNEYSYYNIILGITSRYNFDDINDFIVDGGMSSRDDNYRTKNEHISNYVGHMGFVPSSKTLDKIETQLNKKGLVIK